MPPLENKRDDWWPHAEVVIFPLLYTSLFVKSLTGRKMIRLHIVQDTAAFK